MHSTELAERGHHSHFFMEQTFQLLFWGRQTNLIFWDRQTIFFLKFEANKLFFSNFEAKKMACAKTWTGLWTFIKFIFKKSEKSKDTFNCTLIRKCLCTSNGLINIFKIIRKNTQLLWLLQRRLGIGHSKISQESGASFKV